MTGREHLEDTHGCEDNSKMDLKEIDVEDMYWVLLADSRQ
jgi:hypothetical protein